MHAASHKYQYPKVTPVAPQGGSPKQPSAVAPQGAATPPRPQR
ncbi:MAG TPA: hypothetical protein VI318_08650 [Baekduia sp.]